MSYKNQYLDFLLREFNACPTAWGRSRIRAKAREFCETMGTPAPLWARPYKRRTEKSRETRHAEKRAYNRAYYLAHRGKTVKRGDKRRNRRIPQ